jgi:hypothetical protein
LSGKHDNAKGNDDSGYDNGDEPPDIEEIQQFVQKCFKKLCHTLSFDESYAEMVKH